MLNNSGNDFVNFVVKEFGELAELFKQKMNSTAAETLWRTSVPAR